MLTTFVQLLQTVTLGKNSLISSISRTYMRCSHGGLSAVMKLTKMFAENVSTFLGLLESRTERGLGRCWYPLRGPITRWKEGDQ